jgi:ABC-type Fe3+-hydroxamate transport system substrate-binding protein
VDIDVLVGVDVLVDVLVVVVGEGVATAVASATSSATSATSAAAAASAVVTVTVAVIATIVSTATVAVAKTVVVVVVVGGPAAATVVALGKSAVADGNFNWSHMSNGAVPNRSGRSEDAEGDGGEDDRVHNSHLHLVYLLDYNKSVSCFHLCKWERESYTKV